MKILCWNVNSIKSCQEFLKTSYGSDYPTSPVSGIHSFFQAVGTPDLVCFQETKLSSVTATNESHLQVPGYDAFWSIASKGPSGSAKRGYSGTVTYARKGAVKFASSKFMKEPCYVNEGRITMTDHGGFVLLNVYFPNGGMNSAREKFKADFNNTFRTQVKSLFNQKRHVIVLGDFNVARLEIDVYNAEKYKSFSGHLPSEREWAEQLLADGFVDAYRHLHPDTTAKYTFWDQRRQLRPKNKGWRIDCFYVSKSLASKIKSCQLLSSVGVSCTLLSLLIFDIRRRLFVPRYTDQTIAP